MTSLKLEIVLSNFTDGSGASPSLFSLVIVLQKSSSYVMLMNQVGCDKELQLYTQINSFEFMYRYQAFILPEKMVPSNFRVETGAGHFMFGSQADSITFEPIFVSLTPTTVVHTPALITVKQTE